MNGVRALLVDVGGTNVRFATLMEDGAIAHSEAWFTAFYPDFAAAVAAYGACVGLEFPVGAVCVCAAGPVIADVIDLTNCPWKIVRSDIARATGASRVLLVNDFAAVARALPGLAADGLVQTGGGSPLAGAPKIALGPGTGLGIASAIADGQGGWVIAPGEGGHSDLAATSERELAVVYQLMREFGHVSVERVLSGPGLETLYLAIAALDGLTLKAKPIAADIAKAAHGGRDAAAVEAVSLFTGWLGSLAGNLALVLGGQGGVYIAGGIVRQWGPQFDAKLFRRRFEAKGRMRHFLEAIPTYVVTADDLAFRGLAAMLG